MNRYDLIILGSIAEEPLSGYDIIQRVKDKHMDKWAKIHVSTVYARLTALESKEFLNSQTEKEGNRPERTIYTLTDLGRENLTKEILDHLTGFNDDPRTLGFAFLHGTDSTFILPVLNKQAEYLTNEIERISELINSVKEETFFEEGPFLNCMSRDHLKVELKYVKAAIEILGKPENAKQMTETFSINRIKNFKSNQNAQEMK
jgi:DNA-binding PadR family transcriptional regulator